MSQQPTRAERTLLAREKWRENHEALKLPRPEVIPAGQSPKRLDCGYLAYLEHEDGTRNMITIHCNGNNCLACLARREELESGE